MTTLIQHRYPAWIAETIAQELRKHAWKMHLQARIRWVAWL